MKEIVLITCTSEAAHYAPTLMQKALPIETTFAHISQKNIAKDLYFEAVYQAVQNAQPDIAGFVFVGEQENMVDLAKLLDRKFIETHTKRIKSVVFASDGNDTLFASLCAATAICLFGEPNVYVAKGSVHLVWQYQESSETEAALSR